MLRSSQRPSDVLYEFTSGLGGPDRAKLGILAPGWISFDAMIPGAMIHMAAPSSDTSTTAGSPVRSRPNSAAAMPPAMVSAPIESPNAAVGPTGWSAPNSVRVAPTPPRYQKLAASNPPLW